MLETAARIPPKRAMSLVRRRTLKKVTFCLFLALGGFLCWYISHVVQLTFLRSYCVLEYQGELQELAMVMSNAKSPTNTFSATQSSDKLKHHKTTLITTTSCGRPYFLLVVVSSAPYYAQKRRDIRLTWGVDSDLNSRWKTVFLVAQTRNRTESEALLQEGETFGDLIRADYYDDYWNQTLKIQMAFEWASKYCQFSFLLKMDDDVFVNTRALISLLKNPKTPRENLYTGKVHEHAKVIRHGKWQVSENEYNGTFYPPFCPGFGIALSSDVVDTFVGLFDVIPRFRLDDFYIGLLANKTGVKPIHNRNFEVWPNKKNRCSFISSTLVRHTVIGDCLFKVYNEMLSYLSAVKG